MTAGVEGDRIAEVIVEVGAGRPGRRGSGYRVTASTVLTAAHVVADATGVLVRFKADRPDEWSTVATVEVADASADVAALRISARSPEERLGPARYGRIGGRAAAVPCTVVGFPRFKLREDAPHRAGNRPPARYRDSHHAEGTIPSLSNWREGSLEVLVAPPERDPDPQHSPWEGMSGAAVWCRDRIVGLVSEHHRSDGLNRLAAVRIDRWYERLPEDTLLRLRELTGLPASAHQLVDVVADHPGVQLSTAPAVAPSELPAATGEFVDRAAALSQVCEALGSATDGEAGGNPVLVAVAGGAGVGKTALVLCAAHRSRAGFPDGQLFVNLSGAGPEALAPGAVLGEFLRALGLSNLPESVQDRARLYRSVIAQGRYLVVLDNARDEEQARPLLPGAAGSAVLLTSRSWLTLLDATCMVKLDVLDEQDAVTLLGRLAGPGRVGEQATDAERIARSCGGLPLALRIAGARLASRPHWRLARLADRLADERRRLKELQMGDAEVRAGFILSYQALDIEERRLFRLLGLVGMLDFPAWVSAALLDAPPDDAEELAERLVEEHLLQVSGPAGDGPARYQFHDLLRAFAVERVDEETTPEERGAAVERVLCVCFALADRADSGFSAANSAVWDRPERWPLASEPAEFLAFLDTPLEWFTRERANLLRMLDEAYRLGLWSWVWRLAAVMWQYLELTSRWTEWRAACELAVSAAEHAADQCARGHSVRLLGRLALARGEIELAGELMTQAATLLREAADLFGQSMATKDLSVVERLRNRHTRAAELLLTALDGFRRLDQWYWVVIVDRELGIEYRSLAQWQDARDRFSASIAAFERMGEELQLADTWFELGVLERMQQNWTAAADCLARARPVFERFGADGLVAWAERERGLVQSGQGDLAAAADTLQRCLSLWDALDDPRQRAGTLHELAIVRQRQGLIADALRACTAATAAFEDVGDRLSAARTRVTSGAVSVDGREAATAVSTVAPTIGVFREYEDLIWEVKAQRVLASGYAAQGDQRAADDAARLADSLAHYARAADEARV